MQRKDIKPQKEEGWLKFIQYQTALLFPGFDNFLLWVMSLLLLWLVTADL